MFSIVSPAHATNPHPVEGMLSYMESMLKCGLTVREIEIITKATPTRLLSLVTK